MPRLTKAEYRLILTHFRQRAHNAWKKNDYAKADSYEQGVTKVHKLIAGGEV